MQGSAGWSGAWARGERSPRRTRAAAPAIRESPRPAARRDGAGDAGGGAGWTSGEFPTSPAFPLFDPPPVAGVALAVVLGLRRLRREALIF